MKGIKTISVAALFLGIFQINAQKKETDTKKKEEVQQKSVDNPPKCSNIKEGTFLRSNYPKNLWYMTVKDNVQTEYYNDGKDFVKSTMVFIDDCNYKSIVLEKTEKENLIKVGDVFSNKIVATQDNYLKVETKIDNDQYSFVLIKEK
ncbi:hypothetical protein [Chryseobacterium sp. SIMBA_029]|uniref:hypothetical protein n=1 Tax=Chryseobacterium sp. SIMBA_029 TaxID=3085772 RepID=UPI00397B4536